MSKLKSLESLLIEEIKDLFSAEGQLVKALPKMAKAASDPALKEAFLSHLKQTEGQVDRLEDVAKLLGATPRGKTCKAMQGLIEEGAEVIAEDGDPMIKDLALIVAAQKVEHYEITTYGSLVQLAITLGEQDIADLLATTLQEEKETDAHLTQIAENEINWEAKAEGNGQTR